MKYRMPLILTGLFFFSFFVSRSQDITFYDYKFRKTDVAGARFFSTVKRTDSGYLRNDYYMKGQTAQMSGYYADSGLKIRSGKFTYWYPNNKIKSFGEYRNNEKSGTWLSFYPDEGLMDSTVYNDKGDPIGTSLRYHRNGFPSDSSIILDDGSGVRVGWFDNGNPSYAGRLAVGGEKNGRWNYFHKTGKLSAIAIYENGRIIKKEHYDESGKLLRDTVADSEAEFPGGDVGWSKFLGKVIYWPNDFKIVNADEVIVVVEFRVDEEGMVQDVEMVVPFADAFDKIAIQAMKRSPAWKPAIQENRKVNGYFRQPIVFRQETEE
ncbi:MAG: energy transducer TonB [Chitinophagaceae bacterium]|nr:energy transducer TonB [Chitinophagaceae bacterium]